MLFRSQSALYDRIAAVKAVAGDVPVEGRIVFTGRGKFPKGLPKWTLMVDSLRAEFPPVDHDSLAGALTRFNEASRRAHAHLGWKLVGRAFFLRAWRVEVMGSTIFPYVHISFGLSQRVLMKLSPNVLSGS